MEVSRSGDVTVIRFTRRDLSDEAAIRAVSDEMMRLESLGRHRILVDFAAVRHLSSSMLATLVHLQKQALEGGGRLALSSLEPAVFRLFEVTHLHRVFSFYANEKEALDTFSDS